MDLISDAETEMASLKEQLEQLSHLQNVQVTSEIDLIAFEEQIDQLKLEKDEIEKEKAEITEHNQRLLEKIELLGKEKQEITIKLDSYMQENMDLIDKLEKLSAEKVSSAESIEIVEGLTRQEEIELEGYQKSMMDNIKASEENLEQNPELNDSVNQLTEETSELLKKIELFTNERREVMEKMEILTQENNHLIIKLQEVENNRDTLIETYEQLQNEKEILDSRFAKLEEQAILADKYKTLLDENESLRATSQESKDFEFDYEEMKQKIEKLTIENEAYQKEINDLKLEFENKMSSQQEEYNNTVEELYKQIDQKEEELSYLKDILEKTENQIKNLEDDQSMVAVESQLNELKESLKTNVEKTVDYERELEENSRTISVLSGDLQSVNNSLSEMKQLLESKEDEIKKLRKDCDNKESVISTLQEEIKNKNEEFYSVCNRLKENCKSMQLQVDQNAKSLESIRQPLEQKVEELTSKNRDQLEKMKKIAANLKKKSQAYQELDQKYGELKEKWENESREKDELKSLAENKDLQIVELENKMHSLVQQLQEVEDELSNVQSMFDTKVREHELLVDEFNNFKEQCNGNTKAEVADMPQPQAEFLMEANVQTKLQQYEIQVASLLEENEMLKLNQNVERKAKDDSASQFNTSALQMKIQELEMYIETQDAELTAYKNRVTRLEEGLANVEERRFSLEQKAIELGTQLQEKSESLEEISQTEDMLEERLKILQLHDQAVERRLQQTMTENQTLLIQMNTLMEENAELKHKISVSYNKVTEMTVTCENIASLENENSELQKVISNLESRLKNITADYEKKLKEKETEMDRTESTMQEEFNQLNEDRKNLTEQVERLTDQCNEYVNNQDTMKETCYEYKQKIEVLQIELQENISTVQRLDALNKEYSSKLEEFQKCGSATPKEIQSLKDVIHKKDQEIEEYQKQNLQLQMQSSFGQGSEFDKLLSKSDKSDAQEVSIVNQDVQTLQGRLSELETMEQQHKNEVSEYQDKINKLESQLYAKETAGELTENIPVREKHVTFAVPLDTASQDSDDESTKETTEQQLKNKIKTLEFMLYSVEKEKEEAVLQCHAFTNELTKLVFEREDMNRVREKLKMLQSQILKNEDLADTLQPQKELHDLEFTAAKAVVATPSSSDNLKPVVEDIVTPQSAYLCYDVEDNAQSDVKLQTVADNRQQTALKLETFKMIQSEILKNEDLADTPETQKELHELEFTAAKAVVTTPSGSDQLRPVVEDIITPQSAYLCYEAEDNAHSSTVADNRQQAALNLETFEENDDGWAWGPEEAKLEEEHRIQKATSPQSAATVEQFAEKVRVLEIERERHIEEIKQLQVKSGKLIKKLKELKQKNEQLNAQMATQKSEFGDLDDAIQDELKLQIDNLEKKRKEVAAQLEQEKSEKNNLQKKVDILSTANDRLIELKEKQDNEMLFWQQQNRDLQNRLSQFDWGNEEFEPSANKSSPAKNQSDTTVQDNNDSLQKIEELTKTIKELSLDNEELQMLLEEQKKQQLSEKKAAFTEQGNTVTKGEYEILLAEKNYLSTQIEASGDEKKRLQDEVNTLIQQNGNLKEELDKLASDKQKVTNLLQEKEEIICELTLNLNNLQAEYRTLLQKHETFKNDDYNDLLSKFEAVEQEKQWLHRQLEEIKMANENMSIVNQDISVLREELKAANERNELLYQELEQKNAQICALNESMYTQTETLRQQLDEQRTVIESLTADKMQLILTIQEKENELLEINEKSKIELAHKLSTTVEQLSQEWVQRVDQRGNDVAESWKLHLEMKENEFMQLEEQLRKEVYELEEKCNALVNENNELRKNVDAEIRNEVDHMSALQQQITAKQQYINELVNSLQEKQHATEFLQQRFSEVEAKLHERDLKITDLETTLLLKQDEVAEKQIAINSLNSKIEGSYDIEEQLNEKQNVITQLQQQLDEHISNNNRIEELTLQLRDVNAAYVQVQEDLANKEQSLCSACAEVENYKLQLQEMQKALENTAGEAKFIESLQEQIYDCQQQVALLYADIENKKVQIDTLTKDIQNKQELLASREIEISQLNAVILELKQQATIGQQQYEQLAILNSEISNYKELLISKNTEIENLQVQIEEGHRELGSSAVKNEDIIVGLQAELDKKNIECETLQSKLEEQSALVEEENKQLSDLRKIIEDQVLKIEELKQELFQKSNDYDVLIAELDMHHQPEASRVQKSFTQEPSSSEQTEEPDLSEPVNRAELDLALYMLHQRDVRCEELTMELMQLLEERDTLQLRLSNAIREKEILKSTIGTRSHAENLDVDTSDRETLPQSKTSAIMLEATRTELATDALEAASSTADTKVLADK